LLLEAWQLIQSRQVPNLELGWPWERLKFSTWKRQRFCRRSI
jgi:hypothetical protein